MILFIWGTQVVSDQKRGMKNLATLSLLMFFIRNLPVPGGVSSASRQWLGGAAGGGVASSSSCAIITAPVTQLVIHLDKITYKKKKKN